VARKTVVQKIISRIPLIGALPDTSWEDHKSALTELLLVLVFSFSPIFVAILGDYYFMQNFSIPTSVKDNIVNGELFLYVTALMAPLFYILLRERYKEQRFPCLTSCMLTYIVVLGVAAISFAYQRSNSQNQDAVYKVSLAVSCIALILNYLVLVYNSHLLPDAARKIREDEDDFADKVSSRRGSE